VKSLSTYITQN